MNRAANLSEQTIENPAPMAATTVPPDNAPLDGTRPVTRNTDVGAHVSLDLAPC